MSTSKKNGFFPVGPVSSAMMCSTAMPPTGDKPGPPAKEAFSSEEEMDKEKSQQQASLSHVVEDFFWIGSSIIAFSKWRLGYMGKISQLNESRVRVVGYHTYQAFVNIYKTVPHHFRNPLHYQSARPGLYLTLVCGQCCCVFVQVAMETPDPSILYCGI